MRPLLTSALAALLLAGSIGCASPAADYVRAEKAAWDQFDPYLDLWIDDARERGEITPELANALHKVNTGRRVRVAHAIVTMRSAAPDVTNNVLCPCDGAQFIQYANQSASRSLSIVFTGWIDER